MLTVVWTKLREAHGKGGSLMLVSITSTHAGKELARFSLVLVRISVLSARVVHINCGHGLDRWFSVYHIEPFLLATLMMASIIHCLGSANRLEANYVLITIRAVIYSAWGFLHAGRLTTAQSALLKQIPDDVRAALQFLNVEPEYTLYACCTSCCALYPPYRSPGNKDDRYQHVCTHRPTQGDSICGQVLVQQNPKGEWRPIKSFAFQSLHGWIAQLLCRRGIEEELARSWVVNDPTCCSDIMQSPAIQNFRGPDNATLFSDQATGKYNLVFALFVDWFNPFGNKKAGKSHSVGGMYMTCLNLPPSIRYKPENMYLAGIIPGPREPRLDEINHFLAPLVDALETLWNRGILLSQTAARSTGAIVHAALIPLVCDLPGMRKTAGMMGITSDLHLCGYCDLRKKNINQLAMHFSANRKTRSDHYKHALAWKNAATSKERDEIVVRHGVRWSELLRLPYWDITRYSVVDAMHNLYLGELRHHCMAVWGVQIKGMPKELKQKTAHDVATQKNWLKNVADAVRRGSETAVGKARRGYIVAIAELNGVQVPHGSMVKKEYVKALITWVTTRIILCLWFISDASPV